MDFDPDPGRPDTLRSVLLLAVPVCGALGVLGLALASVWLG